MLKPKRQQRAGSGRPLKKVLDWELAQTKAYTILIGSGSFPHTRLPLDSIWAEPLQKAAERAVRLARDGKVPLPATTEELAAALARAAKTIDDNRRGRERARAKLNEANAHRIEANFTSADIYWALDILRVIEQRDLFTKFLAAMHDLLEPDGQALLDAWISAGIPWDDNRALQGHLKLRSLHELHNLKRRFKYRAIQTLIFLGVEKGDLP